VQGVGFRYFVEDAAEKIGIRGFVRNRQDGSVEVYAIGTQEQLKKLRQALEKGPMMSRVSGVQEEPDAFDARYGGNFTIELTSE
jgi:acylphosphatase